MLVTLGIASLVAGMVPVRMRVEVRGIALALPIACLVPGLMILWPPVNTPQSDLVDAVKGIAVVSLLICAVMSLVFTRRLKSMQRSWKGIERGTGTFARFIELYLDL